MPITIFSKKKVQLPTNNFVLFERIGFVCNLALSIMEFKAVTTGIHILEEQKRQKLYTRLKGVTKL